MLNFIPWEWLVAATGMIIAIVWNYLNERKTKKLLRQEYKIEVLTKKLETLELAKDIAENVGAMSDADVERELQQYRKRDNK